MPFTVEFVFLSASEQRPQQQIGDRRQIDDMEANNAPSSASISSPGGGAAAATVPATQSIADELGTLPSGWQMSKTENDRLFFIDHINKRTTWV
jgi:hypothetical protein